MKLGNYKSLISGNALQDCSEYTKDVFDNAKNPGYQVVFEDVYKNFWRKNTKKTLNVNIFENHDIKLLFSNMYLSSKYAKNLVLNLKYFED